MALSKKIVKQFRVLHIKKFSEDITHNVAEHQLKQLAELVRLTTHPREQA